MQQQTFQIYVIALQAVPAQTLRVALGAQNCVINVAQKGADVFLDLYVGNTPIVLGRLCRDRVTLTPERYTGFIGDLFFKDTQGATEPDYNGFGARYTLNYMVPA
ncbi:MAG: hypothetical protein LBH31_07020 [Burkholderiaceae bacterium]|jgi:hypothetical protein|nr:hypothetical protein [Burkholderiaceae bacterium]